MFWTIAWLFFALEVQARWIPKPGLHEFENAINEGDWDWCIYEIERWAIRNGVYPSQNLVWRKGDLTQLYNTYDSESEFNPVISVSRFPEKKEVWEYWNYWSNALTEGTWNPKKHFKNKKEALLVARYHILCLLAHEFGHHLDDRYQIKPTNLNCKEYQADKTSFALQHFLRESHLFKSLSLKYEKLLTAFHQHIPKELRFNLITYDSLQNNCGAISVQYPKDSALMVQYASAYIVRQLAFRNSNFSERDFFSNNHRRNDITWKRDYPLHPFACVYSSTFTDHFHQNRKDAEQRGLKYLNNWGSEESSLLQASGFGIDSSGNIIYTEVSINREINPGDLWLFRMSDTSGNLLNEWHTKPPFSMSCTNIRFHSIAIQNAQSDLVFVVELTNDSLNEKSLFLLYPNSDGLSLNWATLGPPLPDFFTITPGVSNNAYWIIVTGNTFPTINSFEKTDKLPPFFLKKLEPISENINPLITDGNNSVFGFSNNYLVEKRQQFLYTIAGNGMEEFECNQYFSEVSQILAIRWIHDNIIIVGGLKDTGQNRMKYGVMELKRQ